MGPLLIFIYTDNLKPKKKNKKTLVQYKTDSGEQSKARQFTILG